MPKSLDITDEAYKVLEANKSEGYSFKRLASEAIIEKYGKPRQGVGPVQTHDGPLRHPPSHYAGESVLNPTPGAEEVKIAAKLLLKNKGVPELAIGKLDNRNPNYAKIAAAIFELAGGEG
ncbi:MAG: antitoxin VapB family protein [Fibromonadaceae bacterium]|jgi:hypothetical protein|nr:antitoxin VapB family protein [Fibromonadaceae bacterium]